MITHDHSARNINGKSGMTKFSGIICPLLTPFETGGAINRALYSAHAHWVLEQGAHYLSPFGTTGEALSVGIDARMQALDWLIEDGVPASKLMPGTGVTALADTVALTRHAVQAGCAATMVLPSFFFKDAGDDGQARYFEALINAVNDPRLRMILYSIPQNSGVAVSPALTARLNAAFPAHVVAYKDSSGDWANTCAVHEAAPDVAVFPGSEAFLAKGRALGMAGCISATVNVNAAAIRAVFDETADDAGIQTVRKAVQSAGLIPAMKAMVAQRWSDDIWLNLMPPLHDATPETGTALLNELGSLMDHLRP